MASYVGPPPGTVFNFAGTVAPTGYLLCDGSSQLRATYADLFAAIGVLYGSVDGTHFTLPDGQGRMLVGVGSHTDVNAVAKNEGKSVGGRRPVHNHSKTAGAQAMYSGGGFGSGSSGNTMANFDVGPVTGNEPTDSPAYLVVNTIIKF